MTDIIERLRVNMHAYGIAQEAADEIERLRAEVAELRGQYAAMEASLEEYRTLDCEIKEENYRLRKLLRDVVNNPVIFKLPRDYSPLTEDLNNRIDAALGEEKS